MVVNNSSDSRQQGNDGTWRGEGRGEMHSGEMRAELGGWRCSEEGGEGCKGPLGGSFPAKGGTERDAQ